MTNWKINAAEITAKPVEDNPAGWVTTIHWDATLSDENNTARRYGTLSMPNYEEDGIVRRMQQMSVENRNAKLLEWLDEHLTEKADIEAALVAELAEKADPVAEFLELTETE